MPYDRLSRLGNPPILPARQAAAGTARGLRFIATRTHRQAFSRQDKPTRAVGQLLEANSEKIKTLPVVPAAVRCRKTGAASPLSHGGVPHSNDPWWLTYTTNPPTSQQEWDSVLTVGTGPAHAAQRKRTINILLLSPPNSSTRDHGKIVCCLRRTQTMHFPSHRNTWTAPARGWTQLTKAGRKQWYQLQNDASADSLAEHCSISACTTWGGLYVLQRVVL